MGVSQAQRDTQFPCECELMRLTESCLESPSSHRPRDGAGVAGSRHGRRRRRLPRLPAASLVHVITVPQCS